MTHLGILKISLSSDNVILLLKSFLSSRCKKIFPHFIFLFKIEPIIFFPYSGATQIISVINFLYNFIFSNGAKYIDPARLLYVNSCDVEKCNKLSSVSSFDILITLSL